MSKYTTDFPIKQNPLRDSMKTSDQQVKVSLRCAQCNEPVPSGGPHVCKPKKENEDVQNTN